MDISWASSQLICIFYEHFGETKCEAARVSISHVMHIKDGHIKVQQTQMYWNELVSVNLSGIIPYVRSALNHPPPANQIIFS